MANKNNKNLNTKKPSFVSEPPKAPKKESKPLCISAKVQKIMAGIYALFFIALAVYFLIGKNSDTLYMEQNRNLFMNTSEYFHDCMSHPAGMLYWVGTYLTQFFYSPAVGACMLIALWLIAGIMAQIAFRMKYVYTALILIPLVSLLCSDIFTGYWIYYLKYNGYMFASTIGFLVAMLSVYIGRILPEKAKIVWIIVWAFAGYCLFGWFALASTLYIVLNYFLNDEKKLNRYILPAIGIVLAIVVPLICHQLYDNCRMDTAWIEGAPIFASGDDFTPKAELPFVVLAISPILFCFFTKKEEDDEEVRGAMAWGSICTAVVVIAASTFITKAVNFDDYNYHSEMRMYRAVEEQRWEDVLKEMAEIPGDATREMVLFKNIALLNTGHLGDGLFRFNNMSALPHTFDSLKVHMVQTAAPLLYYNHGKLNFASRWCIENSVETGYKVGDLKILTNCAIINSEWDVARKYLDILKHTTFYKDWAEHYEPLVNNPKTIAKYHEFDTVKELYSHMGSTLDGDNGLCEMYIINYFCNTMNKDSKTLQELTLAYALIQKDIQLFWPRFFLYAQMHKGQEMPIHYQEAAYLYGILEPQNVDIRKMPFNKQQVIDRYISFTNMSQQLMSQERTVDGNIDTQKVGEIMKPMFGDTFYWFYFFCRDVKSY